MAFKHIFAASAAALKWLVKLDQTLAKRHDGDTSINSDSSEMGRCKVDPNLELAKADLYQNLAAEDAGMVGVLGFDPGTRFREEYDDGLFQ